MPTRILLGATGYLWLAAFEAVTDRSLLLGASEAARPWLIKIATDDYIAVGNVDGLMTVLRAGRRKEVLAEMEMDSALYARPALVGNALYLATARRLYLIAIDSRHGR